MYVQQAPVPVQASLVSPEILASKIIQLNAGGIAFNTVKIIKVEEDTAQCEISAAENFIEAI